MSDYLIEVLCRLQCIFRDITVVRSSSPTSHVFLTNSPHYILSKPLATFPHKLGINLVHKIKTCLL